jgi:ornithine decarboxylase
MGLGPERIIYANPCKQKSHLKFAAQHKISLMTFDNEYELHKVKAIYPTAKLVLRVKVDDSKSICQFNIKFGANPDDAPHLFSVAKALGLDVSGVSFHVGSGCCDAKAFSKAVAVAKTVFDVAVDAGFKPTLLDIGGGFPGTDETTVTFKEIAFELNRALDEHFPEESGVKIIAEPGRFFAAASHVLVTNVASKRLVDREMSDEMCCDVGDGPIANIQSTKTDTEKAFMYYLNEGVYSSFNCIIFDHIDSPKPKTLQRKHGPLYPSSLWGPTCDSMDKINEYCELPELEIGEWVYFEDMGAYTKSAASTFNGYSKAHSYYVVSSGLQSEIEVVLSGVSLSQATALTRQMALPRLWQSPPLQAVTMKSSDIQLLSVE